MSRKPGPIWVEVNSELARSPDFVCLKDEVKSAYLLWALQHPDGALPGNERLALAIGKSKAAVFKIVRALQVSGFLTLSPGGKYALADGWVRKHKTSAARVAKYRARVGGDCNVTMATDETPIVTSHVTLHTPECNVTSNVSEPLQKEIPLRNPLRKTPNPEVGFGVSARERATPTKTSPIDRVLWREIGSVPEGWLRVAAQERQRIGLEPVDMALVAANFADTYGPQLVNRKTRSEWQGQFNKFTRREFAGKPNGTASGKSRQIDELARIIEREKRAASGGEILQDGDGIFDRENDLRLPREAWREHGGTRQ